MMDALHLTVKRGRSVVIGGIVILVNLFGSW